MNILNLSRREIVFWGCPLDTVCQDPLYCVTTAGEQQLHGILFGGWKVHGCPWIKAFGHQFRHEKLAKDEDSDDDNNEEDDNA